MNVHAEKKELDQNSLAVNSSPTQLAKKNPTLHLPDHRPQAIAQKKQVEALASEKPLQRKLNEDLSGQLKSTAAPVENTAVVQRVPADVNNLLHAGAHADPNLALAPLIVNAVSSGLEMSGVPHRFGGSLAARLQGAGRAPQDVDVEVQNGGDVARAGNALLHLNGRIFTYQHQQALVNSRPDGFIQDLHAGVVLGFTNQANNEQRVVDIDISNENAPAFVAGTRSPHQRGVQPAMGSLVSRGELIMNYIRRILTNPARAAQKGDPHQVRQLLISSGFNPHNAAHVAHLRQLVEHTFNPENVHLGLMILTNIINGA
jgi:hypothetical protein